MQDHAAIAGSAKAPLQAGAGPADEIRALGFGLPASGGRPVVPHGIAVRVPVQTVLEGGDSSTCLRDLLQDCAARAVPACILPQDLGDESTVVGQWDEFCRLLHDFGARSPAFCVHSHQLPLDDFCRIADGKFGSGQRFVSLDGLQMHGTGNKQVEARADSNWRLLWSRCAAGRPLLPVYGGFVRSACPLLADEAATSVLPGIGLQVPCRTAWLPVTLNLVRFANDAGEIDADRLRRAIRLGLPAADALIDEMAWPNLEHRDDAVKNRRLAVMLGGIGDLVLRQRRNPAALDCLRQMDELVALVRLSLDEASAALAKDRSPVPSLEHACPAGDWFDGPHNEIWQRRFDAARQKSAVRHRNMLVMSPYCVLPSKGGGDARYTDLLPLLRHADAWRFAPAVRFRGWNVNQFKHFHKRARAIIQGSQHAAVIAAGV